MTTNYYQTHDITHNNPNDLETLLFLDIYSSLDLDPADIPDAEKVEAARDYYSQCIHEFSELHPEPKEEACQSPLSCATQ